MVHRSVFLRPHGSKRNYVDLLVVSFIPNIVIYASERLL